MIRLRKYSPKKKSNGLFTSNSYNWATPSHIIDDLKEVFAFDLDVCASEPNVCKNFFTESDDGLRQEWEGLCWMNPPYGKTIGDWVYKATGAKGTVVCLLPARTDTRWWQAYAPKSSFVVFISGRLSFVEMDTGKTGTAPFPSAFVVFGEINNEQKEKLSGYGWVPTGAVN